MATWEDACATWSGGTTYVRLIMNQDDQSVGGNWTDVNWSVQSRDTHGSISGTWDWNRYGDIGSASGSVAAATGTRTITSGTKRIYHDANGYGDCTGRARLDVYYGVGDTGTKTLPLSRIPLAPSLNNPTSSSISVVTATISGSVANNGHGTSSTIYLRYKKTADPTWIELSAGATKNLVGLTPGTQYQFASRATNNNGDATGWSGTQTFTTLPAPNTSAALLRIVGVM